MREMVEAVFRQHGTDLLLANPDGIRYVRGLFRAVNSKSWQSMESEATLLGEINRGQYAYIGPADGGVKEGDTISLGDKNFVFRRTEIYFYGNEPIYQWGICVEKGVNDVWELQS